MQVAGDPIGELIWGVDTSVAQGDFIFFLSAEEIH